MSDQDLIRRGDAAQLARRYIHRRDGTVEDEINKLPAVDVAQVRADALRKAQDIADEVFDFFNAKGATDEAFGAAEVGERMRALIDTPAPAPDKVDAEGEAWGILNPFGDLWTHHTFPSEDAARLYVEGFWRGVKNAPDLRQFKPVRVHVRLTLATLAALKGGDA